MDLIGKLGWLRNFPEGCIFFSHVGYISLKKGNTVPNHFISLFISHYPLTNSSLKDTTKFDKRVESYYMTETVLGAEDIK